jgi:hypothetical protein
VGTHPSRLEPGEDVELIGRRASPLFIKILRCGTQANKFVPLFLWLPAVFLPDAPPDNKLAVWVDADGHPKSAVKSPTNVAIERFLFDDASTSPLASVAWTTIAKQGWQEVRLQ